VAGLKPMFCNSLSAEGAKAGRQEGCYNKSLSAEGANADA